MRKVIRGHSALANDRPKFRGHNAGHFFSVQSVKAQDAEWLAWLWLEWEIHNPPTAARRQPSSANYERCELYDYRLVICSR